MVSLFIHVCTCLYLCVQLVLSSMPPKKAFNYLLYMCASLSKLHNILFLLGSGAIIICIFIETVLQKSSFHHLFECINPPGQSTKNPPDHRNSVPFPPAGGNYPRQIQPRAKAPLDQAGHHISRCHLLKVRNCGKMRHQKCGKNGESNNDCEGEK